MPLDQVNANANFSAALADKSVVDLGYGSALQETMRDKMVDMILNSVKQKAEDA